MKILVRIIALPFFMALALIAIIESWLKTGYLFLIYGGEVIYYDKPKSTIKDVYDAVAAQVENNSNEKKQ